MEFIQTWLKLGLQSSEGTVKKAFRKHCTEKNLLDRDAFSSLIETEVMSFTFLFLHNQFIIAFFFLS